MSTEVFGQSLAVIIGIDQYGQGISPLQNAVNDAQRLAEILKETHGYNPHIFLNQDASLGALKNLFESFLPEKVSETDRVLVYFAGHGIALDGEDGPAGYLIPQDASQEDRNSFLSMQSLHDCLAALPCRHMLVVLDCCFAGTFRWATLRDLRAVPKTLYQERFERYVRDPAWHLLTSAAYDEKASDTAFVLDGHNRQAGRHSPFAQALFDALEGAADIFPLAQDGMPAGNGVITVTELFLYLRGRFENLQPVSSLKQTPGLWPLRKHGKGEFIFLAPNKTLHLPPAPTLNMANNPYRGLESFGEEHHTLFFGRERLVDQLEAKLSKEVCPLLAILGASGTGKSSLLKAGLIHRLRQSDHSNLKIIGPLRPGKEPCKRLASSLRNLIGMQSEIIFSELTAVIENWLKNQPGVQLLIVIDQFEELMTQCQERKEREQFLSTLKNWLKQFSGRLRIVLTLRSDFEPQFANGELKSVWIPESRYVVQRMTQDELRQAIEGPALEKVIYFEPSNFVDELINAVIDIPGPLPLLSFTLSELYLKYLKGQKNNRSLTKTDYKILGGVTNALAQRATEEYISLSQAEVSFADTARRVILRMVSVTSNELVRRQVPIAELEYSTQEENQKVQKIIERFTAARLFVRGLNSQGEPYVEPAHDILVTAWPQIQQWVDNQRQELSLQRQITQRATHWHQADRSLDTLLRGKELQKAEEYLNAHPNDLNRIEQIYIHTSQKLKRRNRIRIYSSVTAASVAVIAGVSFGWWQLQKSTLDQLIRDAAIGNQSPEVSRQVARRLPKRLKRAEKAAQAGNADQAAADYQEILAATNKLLRTLGEQPEQLDELIQEKELMQQISQDAESGLADIIRVHRIPQLEKELEIGNIGELVEPDFALLENQYSGALRITYAILMREFGAKADLNDDGYLNDFEEEQIPCETLKDIEEAWRRLTSQRCGFYGEKDIYESPRCQELGGDSLTVKITFPPAIYLLERRLNEQCQIFL